MTINKRAARSVKNNISFYIISILLTALTSVLIVGAVSTGRNLTKVVKNFATYVRKVHCIEPKKWNTHKSKDEKTLSIFSPRVSKIGYIMLKPPNIIYTILYYQIHL